MLFPTFTIPSNIGSTIRFIAGTDDRKKLDSEWNDQAIPSLTATQTYSDDSFVTAASNVLCDSTSLDSCYKNNSDDGHKIRSAVTPEGLRPRRSFLTIGKELGISSDDLSAKNGFDVAQNLILAPSLPLHDCVIQRSLGAAKSHTVSSSPQPSAQSLDSLYHKHFASWSTNDQQSSMQSTATSPILHPTRARTAVGAAVAAITDNLNFQSWHNDNCHINPYKSASARSCDKSRCSDKRGEGLGATNDEVQFSSKTFNFVETDGNSSIAASPSSRAKDLNRPNPFPSQGNEVNISFNSTTNTVKVAHGTLVGTVGAFPPAEPAFAIYNNTFSRNELESRISDRNHLVWMSDSLSSEINKAIHWKRSEHWYGPQSLQNADINPLRAPSRNPRRYREELICAALERLRDNVQLVLEVESLDSLAFEKILKASVSQEGILTGFSKRESHRILNHVGVLINEIKNGTPIEEFFFSSPSQVEEFGCRTAQDLTNALIFCEKIVRLAAPKTTSNRKSKKWIVRPEIQTALGILQCTPASDVAQRSHLEFEEGDEVGTPMTSNVSIATTLTSTAGASRVMNDSRSATNGLHLRHIIVVLATSFQKLSRLLTSSDRKSSSLHTIDQIKHCYFDLLDINSDDIKAIVDSFYFGATECQLDSQREPPLSLSLPALGFRRDNMPARNGNVIPHRRNRANYNRFAPVAADKVEAVVSRGTNIVNRAKHYQGTYEEDDLHRQAECYNQGNDDEIRDASTPNTSEGDRNTLSLHRSAGSSCEKQHRRWLVKGAVRNE